MIKFLFSFVKGCEHVKGFYEINCIYIFYTLSLYFYALGYYPNPNHSIALVLSAADAVRVGLRPVRPQNLYEHDVHFYDMARSKLF